MSVEDLETFRAAQKAAQRRWQEHIREHDWKCARRVERQLISLPGKDDDSES